MRGSWVNGAGAVVERTSEGEYELMIAAVVEGAAIGGIPLDESYARSEQSRKSLSYWCQEEKQDYSHQHRSREAKSKRKNKRNWEKTSPHYVGQSFFSWSAPGAVVLARSFPRFTKFAARVRNTTISEHVFAFRMTTKVDFATNQRLNSSSSVRKAQGRDDFRVKVADACKTKNRSRGGWNILKNVTRVRETKCKTWVPRRYRTRTVGKAPGGADPTTDGTLDCNTLKLGYLYRTSSQSLPAKFLQDGFLTLIKLP